VATWSRQASLSCAIAVGPALSRSAGPMGLLAGQPALGRDESAHPSRPPHGWTSMDVAIQQGNRV